MPNGQQPVEWDDLYRHGDHADLGWFETRPATLELVLAAAQDTNAAVIDIGAGASHLPDHLIERGFDDLTLLDLSAEALDTTRLRLAAHAEHVRFTVADVTTWQPDRQWDVWHDRATFHFLVEDDARTAYRRTLASALATGGGAVIATFASDGPTTCAGRPVRRYDADALAFEFAAELEVVECSVSPPAAPGSDARPYTMCRFRRR